MVQPVPQSPRESALTKKLRPGGSVGMGGRRAGTGSNRPSVDGVGRPVVRLRRQWLKEWIRHGWKERFVCRSQDGSRGSGTAAVPGRPWAGIHQPVMGAQLMHGRLAAALQNSVWGPDPRECGGHLQTRGHCRSWTPEGLRRRSALDPDEAGSAGLLELPCSVTIAQTGQAFAQQPIIHFQPATLGPACLKSIYGHRGLSGLTMG